MFLLHKLLLWKFFLWLQSKYIHGMRHGVLIWIFMSGAVYMVMDIIIAGKLNLLKHFILKLFFFKPKNKAIFFKVWALKFILQILSSNFYLRASFAKLLRFQGALNVLLSACLFHLSCANGTFNFHHEEGSIYYFKLGHKSLPRPPKKAKQNKALVDCWKNFLPNKTEQNVFRLRNKNKTKRFSNFDSWKNFLCQSLLKSRPWQIWKCHTRFFRYKKKKTEKILMVLCFLFWSSFFCFWFHWSIYRKEQKFVSVW